MKMTKVSHYAIIALTHMAQQKDVTIPIASHDIAWEHNIPDRFLLKVLEPLVSASILRSCRGPRGGYVLNRAASEISLLNIIEAAENDTIEGTIPPPYKPNPKKSKKPKGGKKPKKGKKAKKEREPNPDAENNNTAVNIKLESICQQTAKLIREHLSSVKLSDLAKSSKKTATKAKPAEEE